VSCYGQDNGFIDITVNGNGIYEYLWSNGATTEDLSNIGPGTYSITITDLLTGCSTINSVLLTDPEILSLTVATNDIACAGENDGLAALSVSGGTIPYVFDLSGPDGFFSTESIVDGLVAGLYQWNVTDFNGCFESIEFELTEPSEIILDVETGTLPCPEDSLDWSESNNYFIYAGGAPPISLYWFTSLADAENNNFENAMDINALTPGEYYLLTFDANGCTAIDNYVIGSAEDGCDGVVLDEHNPSRSLLKIVDVMGRDVVLGSQNRIVFYIYDDGWIEKKYLLK